MKAHFTALGVLGPLCVSFTSAFGQSAVPLDQAVKEGQAGKNKSASIPAIQAALWMDREDLSATELKGRFPVEDSDITVARAMVAAVAKSPAERPPIKKVTTPRIEGERKDGVAYWPVRVQNPR